MAFEDYSNRHDDEHDRGLVHDLQTIGSRAMERRRALAFLVSAGTTALVSGCGDGSGGSASTTATTTTVTPTPSPSAAASPTPSPTPTSTSSAAAGSCVADPTETNGPYPADGTNTANGATSNVLNSSGIVRSDIRASFISSTSVAAGVLVTLTLKLVDVAAGCTPIAGAAIYLWQCDGQGRYSLYSSGAITESYLRGVQVTNANGDVTFTTIYPACYDGRWPHIHFEVFRGGLTAASTGRTASLISQLAMPAATNVEVFNGDSRYSASIANYSRVSLASDGVFGNNTAAEIAQMTPSMSGSVAAGYTANALIGI